MRTGHRWEPRHSSAQTCPRCGKRRTSTPEGQRAHAGADGQQLGPGSPPCLRRTP